MAENFFGVCPLSASLLVCFSDSGAGLRARHLGWGGENEICHQREEAGRDARPTDLQKGEKLMAERYYRRRLPHWRSSESIYFVTWRLAKTQPELIPLERDLVACALREFDGQRYRLIAFVVMNDHVHALLGVMDDFRLEDVMQSWKSYTANRMQRQFERRGRVWQDEYFDRIVRDEKELEQKFDYIRGNPWARWPQAQAYRWVWPEESE
jgi:putative transposase